MKTTTLMLLIAMLLVLAFFAGVVSPRASQSQVIGDGDDFLADTWEAAVRDVAEQLLSEEFVADSELSIVDVLEGKEHTTFPAVDRYAVIRFEDGKARILGQNGEGRS